MISHKEANDKLTKDFSVNFTNGIYDINSGTFHEEQNNLAFPNTGYQYTSWKDLDPLISSEFLSFIYRIFPNHNDLQIFIQKTCEFIFKTQYVCFWYGTGCNGKSTLAELLELTFGQYVNESNDVFIHKDSYITYTHTNTNTINKSDSSDSDESIELDVSNNKPLYKKLLIISCIKPSLDLNYVQFNEIINNTIFFSDTMLSCWKIYFFHFLLEYYHINQNKSIYSSIIKETLY